MSYSFWGKVNLVFRKPPQKRKSRGEFRNEGSRDQELDPPKPNHSLRELPIHEMLSHHIRQMMTSRHVEKQRLVFLQAFRAATQLQYAPVDNSINYFFPLQRRSVPTLYHGWNHKIFLSLWVQTEILVLPFATICVSFLCL